MKFGDLLRGRFNMLEDTLSIMSRSSASTATVIVSTLSWVFPPSYEMEYM
jgi:hypothetical protein